MATLYTNLTSVAATTAPQNRVNGELVTRHDLVADATYITTGLEAAGDLIDIVKLPRGAVVQTARSRVSYEATGGTGTAVSTLGDAIDDDRYSVTSIATTSAGTTAFTPIAANEVNPYATVGATATTAETQTIKAKLALSSGSVTAGKRIRFEIVYRQY